MGDGPKIKEEEAVAGRGLAPRGDSGDREEGKVLGQGLVSDWYRPRGQLEANAGLGDPVFHSLLVLFHPFDPTNLRLPPYPQPFLPLGRDFIPGAGGIFLDYTDFFFFIFFFLKAMCFFLFW